MTVRCENPRQFAPYSSRGPRNQRYALSHDPMLLNKLHNVQPSRETRAYALGGMQATCKPIGALKRTVPRNRMAITAAKCARPGAAAAYIKNSACFAPGGSDSIKYRSIC